MIKPLYKWQGGKTKLLNDYDKVFIPELHNTYVEPFFGGGALFCKMYNENRFSKYIINDNNKYLMNIYKTIKNNEKVFVFIFMLKEIESVYLKLNKEERKEYYYKKREEYHFMNELITDIDSEDYFIHCTSILFFLLKTSFNGLWQPMKTRSDLFGTAFGLGNEKKLFDYSLIMEWHKALQLCEIFNMDYKSLYFEDDSFVFCDPPYLDNTVKYGSTVFDTARLLRWCEEKSLCNSVYMSNRYTKDSYYETFCDYSSKHVFDVFYTGGKKSVNQNKEVLLFWKKKQKIKTEMAA